MRVSAVVIGLAAFSNSALAGVYYGASSSAASWAVTSKPAASYGSSGYSPIQQISDGQIQNPTAPPESCYTPAPSYYTPAPPAPSAPVSPPSYSNHTAVISTPKTFASETYHAPTYVSPVATASKPPVVQTGAANALVGSTVSLGFAAFLAALLG